MNRLLKYTLISTLCIIISVTIHSYYHFLYKPKQLINKNKIVYDAIIVPGVPFDKEGWSFFMKWRTYWGVHLYKEGITKNIIFSGAAVHTPYIEAEIMKKYAMALGVDSNHIFTENKAEHSTENLYYSNLIAQKNDFKNIALATNPFQSYRLESFIEKVNKDIYLLPIVYGILSEKELKNIQIDPQDAFVENFTALSDREDFFERMRGTNGEKINFNQTQ